MNISDLIIQLTEYNPKVVFVTDSSMVMEQSTFLHIAEIPKFSEKCDGCLGVIYGVVCVKEDFDGILLKPKDYKLYGAPFYVKTIHSSENCVVIYNKQTKKYIALVNPDSIMSIQILRTKNKSEISMWLL